LKSSTYLEIDPNRLATFLGMMILLLLGLGVFGYTITPAGDAGILSWQDWRVEQNRRAFQKEITFLQLQVDELADLLNAPVDAVRGQLIADQVLVALQKPGQPALSESRTRVVQAAQAVRQWSIGQGSRAAAVQSLKEAVQQLEYWQEQTP